MRPILFRWRGLTVWSYPALLCSGIYAGIVAGNAAAHAAGVDASRVYVATLILLVPALVGAKLLHVVTHWPLYRDDVRRAWRRNQGGAALYGGLVVALLCSRPLLTALRLPLGAYWDVAVFTMLVGMIFARVGCLLHGCCCGRPSRSWISLYLPNHVGRWETRLPTQCLEAGLAVILLVFAIAVRRSVAFPGALFLQVAVGYACGRLVLESTREETRAGQFSIHHVISLILIVVSCAALKAHWPP